MSWVLRKTGKALDDLADIWTYIAADNPAAADKLIIELLKLFDRTGDFPEMGRAADEIAAGLRVLTRGSYLLIYRVITDDHAVELVRVVHSAREWPSLFDS
jgi:toxin ParE1/3/4